MWLRAVLGEITSRAAISLLGQAPGDQPQHVDLAGREAGRPFPPPGHPMAGGAENRLDHVAVHAAGLHLGRNSLAAASGARGVAMRTWLAHGLVGVGRPQHPGRQRDRRLRTSRGDSPSRRAARAAAPRSRPSGASAAD